MPFPDIGSHSIRTMVAADRAAVARIVERVGNFNRAEMDCALELVDIYLGNPEQKDYRLAVAERVPGGEVLGYACWGPTPLTRGTFDLYWIATDPEAQGLGIGRALMNHVEQQIIAEQGRLLIIETSSKESYGKTVGFYQRLGYEEKSRLADFYDDGDDKLVFTRRFPR